MMNRHAPRLHRLFLTTLTAATLALMLAGCEKHDHEHADEHGHDHGAHAPAAPLAHSHDPATDTCFICDPTKRDQGRLWCKEHGRYEDRCWLCHPELEDKNRPYCKEHFLYEDECFLCRPELRKDARAPSNRIRAAAHDHDDGHGHDHGHDHGHAHGGDGDLFCHEHGVPEMQCAICQPQLAGSLEPGGSLKVRMPSAASAEKAGVRTDRPRQAESAAGIDALCEVQFNLNALAKVTPLAGGVIRSVRHDVGEVVTAGEVLVELHSAEVASAKSDYLAALVQRDTLRQAFDREKRLREQNIAAEKDYLQAQAALAASELSANQYRQRLANLGFTEIEIGQIERGQDTSALLVVRAPFDGTIIERSAVVGESVSVGGALLVVADLSTRWLILSVPSAHVTRIGTGQQVEARFNELPGVVIRGQITWIDSSIDPRSRMVRARAVVREGAQQIKTGLFGKARIFTGDAQPATLVPRDAVQRHDRGTFVFVQDEADLFSLRRVALGATHGDSVEVLAGLTPTESIVTDGSFIVMSEFLKSRLGAGCADH